MVAELLTTTQPKEFPKQCKNRGPTQQGDNNPIEPIPNLSNSSLPLTKGRRGRRKAKVAKMET